MITKSKITLNIALKITSDKASFTVPKVYEGKLDEGVEISLKGHFMIKVIKWT